MRRESPNSFQRASHDAAPYPSVFTADGNVLIPSASRKSAVGCTTIASTLMANRIGDAVQHAEVAADDRRCCDRLGA